MTRSLLLIRSVCDVAARPERKQQSPTVSFKEVPCSAFANPQTHRETIHFQKNVNTRKRYLIMAPSARQNMQANMGAIVVKYTIINTKPAWDPGRASLNKSLWGCKRSSHSSLYSCYFFLRFAQEYICVKLNKDLSATWLSL